jgi:hypothetical protein
MRDRFSLSTLAHHALWNAVAMHMTNQQRTDDTEAWCDDIPGTLVDGDLLCQWDYLTRTYDSPSFLGEAPSNQDANESAPGRRFHSMVASVEQCTDSYAIHDVSLHGRVDTAQWNQSLLPRNSVRQVYGAMAAPDSILHTPPFWEDDAHRPNAAPLDGLATIQHHGGVMHGTEQSPMTSFVAAASSCSESSAALHGSSPLMEANVSNEPMHYVFTPRFSERLPSHCVPHHHHVVQGGSVDSSRVHVSTDTINNAHVLPVMCPPLTAYNYYYRNERDTIVQGMTHADDPLPLPDWNFTEQKKLELLHQHWYVVWNLIMLSLSRQRANCPRVDLS